MNFEITKRSYAVEIEMERFDALIEVEDHNPCGVTLCEKLSKFVSNVNYDGHFSNYVYFDIDNDDDTDDLKHKIEKTINEHLDWCVSQK